MHKVVCILWDINGRERRRLRTDLLEVAAPKLLEAGASALSMCIADEAADVPSPSPFPLFAPDPSALLNLWVTDLDRAHALIGQMSALNFRVDAYEVQESVYRDYGENKNSGPRNWPDGVRSPGLTAVSLLPRPRRIEREEWIRRWFGRMSPVSEAIQPRTRYVRNLIMAKLNSDAPDFEGIVEEAWPSPKHVRDPFLFYGAGNVWQLIKNMVTIVRAVLHFLPMHRIHTFMVSEYFIKTLPKEPTPIQTDQSAREYP